MNLNVTVLSGCTSGEMTFCPPNSACWANEVALRNVKSAKKVNFFIIEQINFFVNDKIIISLKCRKRTEKNWDMQAFQPK